MVQMSGILGNKVCIAIIERFLERPTEQVTQTELIRALGISKATAIKWSRVLVENGLLNLKERAGARFYSLNKESPVVKQLKLLFLLSELYPKITRLGIEGAEVYIYGSASRGESDEKSDIDILVIGSERGLIQKIKSLDSRIKVSFFTPAEWLKTSRVDSAFFERVDKDKIRLV